LKFTKEKLPSNFENNILDYKAKIILPIGPSTDVDTIKKHMKQIYQSTLLRKLNPKSDSSFIKLNYEENWTMSFMSYKKLSPKLQIFNWACRTDQIKIHSSPINLSKPFKHEDIQTTHSKRITKSCPVCSLSNGNNINHILLKCPQNSILIKARDDKIRREIKSQTKSQPQSIPQSTIKIMEDGQELDGFIVIGITGLINSANKLILEKYGLSLGHWSHIQKSLIQWNYIIYCKWKRIRFLKEFPDVNPVENPFNMED